MAGGKGAGTAAADVIAPGQDPLQGEVTRVAVAGRATEERVEFTESRGACTKARSRRRGRVGGLRSRLFLPAPGHAGARLPAGGQERVDRLRGLRPAPQPGARRPAEWPLRRIS